MGSEKPWHVDKILNPNFPTQKVEDVKFCLSGQPAPNHEILSTNFTGNGVPDIPLNRPLQFTSFPQVDVPPTGIDCISDVSRLDGYNYSDPLSSTGYMLAQNPTRRDVAAFDRKQMAMPVADLNSFSPPLIGKHVIDGASRPVLYHGQYGMEAGNFNNATEGSVQLDLNNKLDGSFLTLGIGANIDAGSSGNGMSLHPQLNVFHDEKAYKSYMNNYFKVTDGISAFKNGGYPTPARNASGEFSSLMQKDGLLSSLQNAGEISTKMPTWGAHSSLQHDVSSTSSLVQNADGCSLSENNFGVTTDTNSSLPQNAEFKRSMKNACQISNIKPSESELPGFMHSANMSSSQVQNSGRYSSIKNLAAIGGSGPILNPNLLNVLPFLKVDPQKHSEEGNFGPKGYKTCEVEYQDLKRGFHGFPGTSSIPHNSRQATLPGSGQQGVDPSTWPSLSPFTSLSSKLTYEQLQRLNMGARQISQLGASVVPAVGVTTNQFEQYKSDQNNSQAQGAAVQNMEDGSIPKKSVVQLAGNLCQSQAASHLLASDQLIARDSPSGQEIPAEDASAPHTSRGAARESVKRKLIRPRLAPTHVQLKKQGRAAPAVAPLAQNATSQPLTQIAHPLPPSIRNTRPPYSLAQASHPRHVTPLAQNATPQPLTQIALPRPPSIRNIRPSHSPAQASHPRHAAPLVQNATSQPLNQIAHPLLSSIRNIRPSHSLAQASHSRKNQISVAHIKRPGPKDPELSGFKCLICKRDLSYTSEGPVFVPSIPPAVAVLPCGHCFHDQCIQRITPEDEIKNPSCIPCALGES